MKTENSCGCNDDFNKEEHENDDNILYLETVDGENIPCTVLGSFDVNNKDYIALLPKNSESVFLYGFKENGKEVELTKIEDDNEYEKISEVFLSMCDTEGKTK